MQIYSDSTRLMVGRFSLQSISEFSGPRMPPERMFPTLSPERLASLIPRLPSGSFVPQLGMIVTSVRTWLVRSDDGIVLLLDTGFGNDKRRPDFPMFHRQKTDWLDRLAAAGVSPGQVTHVVNTHLDHDHVGWNTTLDAADGHDANWRPTFPNARYLMPRAEVVDDIATLPKWNVEAYEDSVRPILAAGLATLVDPPYAIAPGLTLAPAQGHSPGMMVLEISDGHGAGVFAGGDPMHHPLQVLAPDANTPFCQNPAQAAATRLALLGRCADEGWAIAAIHPVSPAIIRVRRDGTGFAFA